MQNEGSVTRKEKKTKFYHKQQYHHQTTVVSRKTSRCKAVGKTKTICAVSRRSLTVAPINNPYN